MGRLQATRVLRHCSDLGILETHADHSQPAGAHHKSDSGEHVGAAGRRRPDAGRPARVA